MAELRSDAPGLFYRTLKSSGVDFIAGVPCSLLAPMFELAANDPEIIYVPAVREDIAVAAACGAILGGRKPAVFMQNSGLGTCGDVLLTLASMYQISPLFVIGWRGCEKKDSPEHVMFGPRTVPLCRQLNLKPYVLANPFSPGRLRAALRRTEGATTAILVGAGILS